MSQQMNNEKIWLYDERASLGFIFSISGNYTPQRREKMFLQETLKTVGI